MSVKGGRGTEVVPETPHLSQMDSPNLSAIDKASFMEGLQLNYGNPLHSTALDEGLNALEGGHGDRAILGRRKIIIAPRTTFIQCGVAVKRKRTQQDGEERKRRSPVTRVKVKTGLRRGASEKVADRGVVKKKSSRSSILLNSSLQVPAANNCFVVKKPTSRRIARIMSAARKTVKSQHLKNQKKETKSDNRNNADGVLQDPSPQKGKIASLGRAKTPFSDCPGCEKSGDPKKADVGKQTRKGHCSLEGTNLEVMLDAFLDYYDQYRKSVDSTAVKESIEYFSNNVKGQLLEKIRSYGKVGVLNKDNTTVGSLIHAKMQRLLDAKYDLMRAERKDVFLQKERFELQHRLTYLRQGQAFLCDITKLNRIYLDHQHKHTTEEETNMQNSCEF